MSLWAIGTPSSGPLLAGGAATVGGLGLGERDHRVVTEQRAEIVMRGKACKQMFRQLDARDRPGRQFAPQFGHARLVPAAHSITFGTRKSPPSTAGALTRLASRRSVSVTASSRRRRCTSCTADSGV